MQVMLLGLGGTKISILHSLNFKIKNKRGNSFRPEI